MLLANRNYDLFNDIFRNPFFESGSNTQTMKCDVKEFEKEYRLEVELPGYAKDDIKAELKDGYLTISANKDEKKEEKDPEGRYLRKERYTGAYKRSFFVGKQVGLKDIKAGLKDGVLTVTIPKAAPQEEKKPEFIEIL